MPQVHRLHEPESHLIRRGTETVVIGTVWAAFAAAVVAATTYDVGKWLAIW